MFDCVESTLVALSAWLTVEDDEAALRCEVGLCCCAIVSLWCGVLNCCCVEIWSRVVLKSTGIEDSVAYSNIALRCG